MKRIASPIALSILVSGPAYAAPITYTDETVTKTVEFDSTGATGRDGNNNGTPDGLDGDPGSGYTLNFIQSNGGTGNTITTVGDGISLSSIGGFGGTPGSLGDYGGNAGNAGVGGDLTITSSGKFVIKASGDQAHGIQASSVGGGGAHGNDSSGNNYVAGLGGIGGAGGAVTVTLGAGATVTTNGTGSNAILAQSIGGQAGDDGVSSSNTGDNPQPDGVRGGVTGLVSVILDEGATLQTYGDQSNGIAATSLSGNGGAGASSDGGLARPMVEMAAMAAPRVAWRSLPTVRSSQAGRFPQALRPSLCLAAVVMAVTRGLFCLPLRAGPVKAARSVT